MVVLSFPLELDIHRGRAYVSLFTSKFSGSSVGPATYLAQKRWGFVSLLREGTWSVSARGRKKTRVSRLSQSLRGGCLFRGQPQCPDLCLLSSQCSVTLSEGRAE